MPIFPKLNQRRKSLRLLVPRLRLKFQRLMVRELIDRDPEFRATAREMVELCNFPRACGDAACARAQTCARDLECYVVTHRTFGKVLPIMQEALARNNRRA